MYEYTASTITTTYTYDSADELTGYSGGGLTITMGYASDGCLTSKCDGSDTWTYVWDQERRLAAFKKNGSTLVEYGYSPTGTRRFASDSTLGLERYFYHGAHALADYDGDWTVTRLYILGASVEEMIAMLDHTADPNAVFYVMVDGLGSTRELVNSDHSVVTSYDYDRWGYPTEQKLVGDTSIRYVGAGEAHDRTGCYSKSSAPSYDPSVGRCIQMARQSPDAWDRGNCYVGMPDWDSLVMWVDPTAGCINWCDENLQKCLSESCDVLGSCSDAASGWQKAPCCRCCRCYFKRCYLQCLADGSGGRRVRAMSGPPSKCKNDNSAAKCAPSCYADHYNVLPHKANIKCDDDPTKEQGQPELTWLNICQSEDWVYEEYGQTTGLDWQERRGDPSDVGYDPFNWYCHYSDARGIQCGGRGTGKTAECTFRQSKDCPSRFPLTMGGHNYYWDDWLYWTRNVNTYEPGPGGYW